MGVNEYDSETEYDKQLKRERIRKRNEGVRAICIQHCSKTILNEVYEGLNKTLDNEQVDKN